MKPAVHALGEIALIVNDLEIMERFYTEVVGLEVLRKFPGIVFYKIGNGYAGHTQILALFHHSVRNRPVRDTKSVSSLFHFALAIGLEDYDREKQRLEDLGQTVRTEEFAWVHWRSLFITDPEGNSIEFVCYDANVI